MKRVWIVSIVAAWLLAAVAHSGAAETEVKRLERPLPAASVGNVGGFLGERIRLSEQNRLAKFDIDHFVRMVEERKQTEWWWIGEQPGKWLEAAILDSQVSNNTEMRAKAAEVLRRLIAAQEPSGYLGITDPKVRTPQKPLRGMDPYELYFTLHALLTASQELGDAKSLEAARKLGDYFVDHIGPGKAEFWPSPVRPPENCRKIITEQRTWVPPGTEKAKTLCDHSEIAGHTAHYGWEGTLLCDPMLRLYQATGDIKYLDWSQWVVGGIDRWSGWDAFSRLDDVAAGKIGVHELQPYVHAHTFQMNFLGFLRLYEITGNRLFLRKVQGAWNDIVARQTYITGGDSIGEHFEPGHLLPNAGSVVETCASMSWMELCQSLLELTADPRYADAIERLMLNHLPAAQACDGDGWSYHTPLIGTEAQGIFGGPHCCSSSGPRILAKIPQLLYAVGSGCVYVNQFVPSTAAVKMADGTDITLKQTSNYPVSDRVVVELTLKQPKKFALRIRVPAWCQNPTLAINGGDVVGVDVKSGKYTIVQRRWQSGDRVELRLPMQPRWVKGEHGNQGLWCLTRGPVVYMLNSVWYDDVSRASIASARPEGDPARLGAVVFDPSDPQTGLKEAELSLPSLGPAYEVALLMPDGKPGKARMVPFANLGRWYRNEAERKNPGTAKQPYAVWITRAKSETGKTP